MYKKMLLLLFCFSLKSAQMLPPNKSEELALEEIQQLVNFHKALAIEDLNSELERIKSEKNNLILMYTSLNAKKNLGYILTIKNYIKTLETIIDLISDHQFSTAFNILNKTIKQFPELELNSVKTDLESIINLLSYNLSQHTDLPKNLASTINVYLKPFHYEQMALLKDCRNTHHLFCWSPDGSKLATCSNIDIKIWDIQNQKIIKSFVCANGYVYHQFSWSPDGKKIATSSGAHDLTIWDANTGQILKKYEGHFENLSSISWSPDSKMLASGSYDNTVRIWQVSDEALNQNLNSQLLYTFDKRHHGSVCVHVLWSLDNDKLAFWAQINLEKHIYIWDIKNQNMINKLIIKNDLTILGWSLDNDELITNEDGNSYISLSPNQKKIAVIYKNSILIYDAVSGDKLDLIYDRINQANKIEWSPDSKLLAVKYDDKQTISILRQTEGLNS